jgi:2,5-diamino-6-(ribosylamino)-4(3H)-pyrimidinone 5'-phosphate reductase
MTTINIPEDALLFPEESRGFLESYLPPKNVPASPFAWATLTFATSLDSQLALSPGAQTVLSGPQSKAMTHYLRSRHDAIMVGVGTAVADDPGLNCRLQGVGGYGGKDLEGQPRPIIIDPKARWDFSENSKILSMVRKGRGKAPLIITCQSNPPIQKKELLEKHGGRYIVLESHASPNGESQLSWANILRSLKEANIENVMIEGGGGVINSLLEPESQELISSVIITIAPTWLGQGGVVVSPRRRLDGSQPIPASRLTSVAWQPFGEDVVLCGRIKPS